jgi:ABC-type antimicrobial peptide transport system permease subunit
MIHEHGLRLPVVGTIIGALASIVAVRLVRAWMYEMSVYDARTLAAVVTLLCVVALIASWLPARRASRVDPVLAVCTD